MTAPATLTTRTLDQLSEALAGVTGPGDTLDLEPDAEPVPIAEFIQAARLRIQKERRHVAARRAYFAGFRDASLPDETRASLFNALSFAADEVRRARADYDDVFAHSVRRGLA